MKKFLHLVGNLPGLYFCTRFLYKEYEKKDKINVYEAINAFCQDHTDTRISCPDFKNKEENYFRTSISLYNTYRFPANTKWYKRKINLEDYEMKKVCDGGNKAEIPVLFTNDWKTFIVVRGCDKLQGEKHLEVIIGFSKEIFNL